MDNELERLFLAIQGKLQATTFPISISAWIEQSTNSNDIPQSLLSIVAHSWCYQTNSIQHISIDVDLCFELNLIEKILKKVLNMKLQNSILHYTTGFIGSNNLPKREFFLLLERIYPFKIDFSNPFPFILRKPDPEHKDSNIVESNSSLLERFFRAGERYDECFSGKICSNGFVEGMGSLNNLCFDASVSHASCASLKLQMLVRGVLERNQIMIGLRQRVFLLLERFSSSYSACDMLHSISGHNLLFAANTKWSTLEPVYKRIVENVEHVETVCKEYNFSTVQASDISLITKVLKLVDIFYKFARELERADIPTLSLLYPGLQHLVKTIKESGDGSMSMIIANLASAVEQNFSEVYKWPGNAIYISASLLDPNVAWMCMEKHKHAFDAISIMATTLFNEKKNNCNLNFGDKSVEIEIMSPFGFGTVKRKRKFHNSEFLMPSTSHLHEELKQYITLVQSDSTSSLNAFDFWSTNEEVPATCAFGTKLLTYFKNEINSNNSEARGVRRKILLQSNHSLIYI